MLNNTINQQAELQYAFKAFFTLCAEARYVPDSAVQQSSCFTRVYTGGSSPFFNCVINETIPDLNLFKTEIPKQLAFFNSNKKPFIWIVPDDSPAEIGTLLHSHGLSSHGSYTAVAGPLQPHLYTLPTPTDLTIHRVTSGFLLEQFSQLVIEVFTMPSTCAIEFATMMQHAAQNSKVTHYLLCNGAGLPISALTAVKNRGLVTFWNGATASSHRRKGYNMLLRKAALADAYLQGCHTGSSFLTNDAMAWGLCAALDFTPVWRFTPYFWIP